MNTCHRRKRLRAIHMCFAHRDCGGNDDDHDGDGDDHDDAAKEDVDDNECDDGICYAGGDIETSFSQFHICPWLSLFI